MDSEKAAAFIDRLKVAVQANENIQLWREETGVDAAVQTLSPDPVQ